jgi:hypothetical protein
MFCETKTIAAIKAHMIPKKFVENPVEQASITPNVSGTRDRYVALAYRMRKKKRYASTVKRGESPLIV